MKRIWDKFLWTGSSSDLNLDSGELDWYLDL
jgi:hypothetical protein